jgi:DHA2 family multidrug resistance protein
LGKVRGFNSLQIGEIMMVMGMSPCLLLHRILADYRQKWIPVLLVGIGLVTASFGVWMNSHMTSLAGMEELFWPQIMRGVGLMCAMIVMSQLALSTLPMTEMKNGSALFNLTRNIGGAIGLAVINTIMDWRVCFSLAAFSGIYRPKSACRARNVRAKVVSFWRGN